MTGKQTKKTAAVKIAGFSQWSRATCDLQSALNQINRLRERIGPDGAHLSYVGLEDAYMHAAIDHAIAYVAGQVHTNGMENFWALFKRCIKGTYVQMAPFHLQRYVDEEVCRFNNRKTDDPARFASVMKRTVGRRITYRQLCEIDGCGFMGLE